MVPAQAKRSRIQRDPRGRSLEIMGDHGTAGRWRTRHCLQKHVDASLVEYGEQARFHKHTLPIHDGRIKHRHRSAVASRSHSIRERRPELKEWGYMAVGLVARTTP